MSGKGRPNFRGNENGGSLEEKFDSDWLSLHVLSIPCDLPHLSE
jgi:hypothetical protein